MKKLSSLIHTRVNIVVVTPIAVEFISGKLYVLKSQTSLDHDSMQLDHD